MKILHVITALDPTTGGPASAMLAMAQSQRRAGADVSIVATYIKPEIDLARRLEQQGIAVEQIGPARGTLRRHPDIAPRLRALVPQHDVVHVHAVWEEIQYRACRAARASGVPYVLTPHGMIDTWSMRQGRIKKMLYLSLRMRRNLNGAALLHFTSAAERDGTRPLGLKSRQAVIPLGIDLAEFASLPPRGLVRARFPQFAGKPLVTFLGRIHQGKGLELLVPALARCGVDDAALLVVGPDFGFRAEVEALAARHGVAGRVVFAGMLRGRERLEALVDSDLFALPSFHENFGLAVVEALACGVPVVISDEVNIHREIAAAQVGAVVPTRVEPLAEALREWLTDAARRRAAAERAAPFVRRTYDLDLIARRWLEEYQNVIAPRAEGVEPVRAGA